MTKAELESESESGSVSELESDTELELKSELKSDTEKLFLLIVILF